jgi:hypothetical protein
MKLKVGFGSQKKTKTTWNRKKNYWIQMKMKMRTLHIILNIFYCDFFFAKKKAKVNKKETSM